MALVTSSVHFVDSDYTTDFRQVIPGAVPPAFASAYADIQISQGSQNVGGGKLLIKSVRVLSIQNLNWRVEFWERSIPLPTGTSLNNWGLLGHVDLLAVPVAANVYYSTQYQIATLFVRTAEGLDIPYHDKSAQGQLHVNLVNLDSTAKNAGDSGAVHIRVGTIVCS